jgi:hypothetical protein
MTPYYINKKQQSTDNGASNQFNRMSEQDYGNPQEQKQGQGWQGILGNVAAGASAGAANSNPKDQFEIDPWLGITSSSSALASSGNWIQAVISGVTSQMGQFSKVNKNLKGLQTGVSGVQYDENGRPVYQGANIVQAQQTTDALKKGEKAISGAVDPGTQIFGALYGTRRKLARKRRQLQRSTAKAQESFNTADVYSREQQNQRSEYLDRINNDSRLFNLYNAQ